MLVPKREKTTLVSQTTIGDIVTEDLLRSVGEVS
jgi:hypothetical protein